MFSFSRFVDALFKGAGHKYIKRIPYNTPKGRRYRYIYNVTHSHQGKHAMDESHLQVGTAFMVHTQSGSEVHGHIKSISGDRVTYVLDDGPNKGQEITKTKSEIVAMMNETHNVSEQVQSKRDALKRQLKTARDNNASEAQIARIHERIDRLGGSPAEGDLTKLSNQELEYAYDKSFDELINLERRADRRLKAWREKIDESRESSPKYKRIADLRTQVDALSDDPTLTDKQFLEKRDKLYDEIERLGDELDEEFGTGYEKDKNDFYTDEEKTEIASIKSKKKKQYAEIKTRKEKQAAEAKERARVERNKRAREKRAEAKRKKEREKREQAEREKREQAEREKREQANRPAPLELTRPETGSKMETRAQRTVDEIINVLQTESRASIAQEMVDEILRGVNDIETLDQIETFIEEQHPEQNDDHRLWARISVFRDELMRS